MSYLPNPTRAWSRVQSQSTYINTDSSYNSIYIHLTGQNVSPIEAEYYDKLQYKGNILQYKGNSAGLSKKQKYAQIAKGLGSSRTKVSETQTQTYTNSNTPSLLRLGFTSYLYPNNQVGDTNNPAGPIQYNVPNQTKALSTVQSQSTYINSDFSYNSTYIPLTNQIVSPSEAEDYDKLQYKGNILQYNGNNTELSKKQNYTQIAKGLETSRTNVFATQTQMYKNSNNEVGEYNNPIDSFQYNVPIQYNGPNPTRVWSRVQSQCTYINPDSSYNSIYIPLTGQTVSSSEALYYDKLQYKGNILQYKGNSAGLSKKQKYAQIAKGLGPSRTKVFATQTQTYTNPNTSSLLRVGFTSYSYPNNQVGEPNNPAGPFQYNVPNPHGCTSTDVQDGGSLISGVYANPCTNDIIKDTNTINQCFPTYCSDVPGQPELLCWNPKQQTYYPRQRLNMNNSSNKWPEGYKGFKSNIVPKSPIITLSYVGPDYVTITWSTIYSSMCPIESFSIYINNVFYKNILNKTNSLYLENIFYKDLNSNESKFNVSMTSEMGNIESVRSNIVNFILNTDNNSDTDTDTDSDTDTDDNYNPIPNCDCNLYNKLLGDNSIIQVSTFLKNYIETYNQNTQTYIDIDTYNTININLYNLKIKMDPSCCFYDVINTYSLIWKTLWMSFNIKYEFYTLIKDSANWQNDSTILHNIELLKEYILNLQKQNYFTSINVFSPLATIKEKYAIYHTLYGIPNELIYDPQLLSNIENTLKTN